MLDFIDVIGLTFIKMIIDYGDIKNPTGNAIIYWQIKGDNPKFRESSLVATNFVISPLHFNEETLMVNFPPVVIEDYEKLLYIAETHYVDLINGGEIYIPKNITDLNGFYKKQIEKYNGVMQDYLFAFKEKLSKKKEEESVPQLINESGRLMDEIRDFVKRKMRAELIKNKIYRLKNIEGKLNLQMKGFDLSKIISLIDRNDAVVDKLVGLYREKFLAIFLEDYERASLLKKKINEIENNLLIPKIN